ncbi:MAG: hypothetical protein J6K86_02000, partial [Clostridia bacterium]|nr:hypothetical protein [Clostridia bacterium]
MTKRNRLASMLLFVLLCVMCVFMGGCQPTPQTSEPEKVKDGIGIELVIDEKSEILVADYITANGNNVETSVDKENITVELENGKITMTAVALGDCVLTISCGEVEVSFNVSVKAKKFSVTVDGAVVGNYEQGSEYELPAFAGTLDENHEFLGWIVDGDDENLKQAADKITVQANVAVTAKIERKAAVLVKASDEAILTVGSEENGELTVNVADYITTYGRDITVESSASDIATATLQDGALTITAVAQGNASVSIACGDLLATISITVNPATVLPTIESGSIAIDLFKQTSGAYTPTVVNPMPMALSYTLAGENDKASVDANGTVSYNADVVETVVLTVNVIAINPFDNEPYELSFTVEVVVSDTTPNAPTFEDKSLSYDLYTTQDGVALDGSVLKAEDEHFTYVYTVDGNEIDASHKFAQTAKVDVAYTYKGNTAKSG